jgi:methionyl-tRNA formyltransferase
MTLKIIFMGTPDFAVPTLEALIEAGHDIVRVYTQPPARAGRGKQVQKSAVHECAQKWSLDVVTPPSLKDEAVKAELCELGADVGVVVAYGQILPKGILEAPRLGCLNLHGSLLPRWRGAAPIQRAIMAGDKETGVQVMQMDEGLDTGDVFLSQSFSIGQHTTAGALHDILCANGAQLMVHTLEGLEAGTLIATAQTEKGATYAKKIEKTEARIDWSRSASDVDRQVRGLSPFPGAWFEIEKDGKPIRVKVLKAKLAFHFGDYGDVIGQPLVVACEEGALQIERVQREGRGAQSVEDFLNGFPIPIGTKLT